MKKVMNITSKGNLGSATGWIDESGEVVNIFVDSFGMALGRVNCTADSLKKAVRENNRKRFCYEEDIVTSPKGFRHLKKDYFSSLEAQAALKSDVSSRSPSQSV